MANVSIDFDPAKLNRTAPDPGKCHLLVEKVKETDKDVKVSAVVLAHEKGEEQIERRIFFSLQLHGGGAQRAVAFALATGILDPDDWAARAASGEKNMRVEFRDAEKRSFCTRIKPGKGEYADRMEIGFDFIDPTSPEADNYPKDESILAGAAEPDTSGVDDVAF